MTEDKQLGNLTNTLSNVFWILAGMWFVLLLYGQVSKYFLVVFFALCPLLIHQAVKFLKMTETGIGKPGEEAEL